MSLHVQRQVIAAREGPLAQLALKRPHARVLAVVSRELVTSRKLPPAALPRAVIGLLARVRAHVRLQMRALRVGLDTVGVRARVHSGRPPSHRHLALTLGDDPRSFGDLG